MKKIAFLVSAGFVAFVAMATSSNAQTTGLTESVYDSVPYYAYYPTATTIQQEQAYMASNAPSYTFINSNDSFNYNGGSDVAQYFGADAAGAALTDTTGLQEIGFNAVGYIDVSTSGDYTFNIHNADDAAAVTIDGNLVVENDFYSGSASATIYLAAGEHSFDLTYFQTVGGLNLDYDVTNAAGSFSYDTSVVPEPISLAILGTSLVGLGFARRRKGTTVLTNATSYS